MAIPYAPGFLLICLVRASKTVKSLTKQHEAQRPSQTVGAGEEEGGGVVMVVRK